MVGSADRCAIAEEIEEIAPHSIILVDEMQSSRREGSTMLEDPNLPVDEREAYVQGIQAMDGSDDEEESVMGSVGCYDIHCTDEFDPKRVEIIGKRTKKSVDMSRCDNDPDDSQMRLFRRLSHLGLKQ